MRDVFALVLPRPQRMCNVVDWKAGKLVYKRYASLYFVAQIDQDDNELMAMELLHTYVEILDSYFTSVCELDLIFNFTRAYWILDELVGAGELLDASKPAVLNAVGTADILAERVPEFGPGAAMVAAASAQASSSSSGRGSHSGTAGAFPGGYP
jgi:AP-1 complex subunit sigma 1/2